MELDYRHVDVVDGIRGISVLLVLWFHFWQQTWLMPSYPTPWLSFIGIKEITPVHIRWVGYLFVDMMVLLSAFCLFLPVARSMILKEDIEDACSFYKKRLARIYPCYALCTIVSFLFVVTEGGYSCSADAVRDLLSHLTFTNMFRIDTYIFSKINGVLWTVALEVQFYAVFPLLAKAFKRLPHTMYIVLVGLGMWFIYGFGVNHFPTSMTVNQFPTFLPVFANGFLCAYIFTLYATKCRCKKLVSYPATCLAILSAVWIRQLIVSCYSYSGDKQIWQLTHRMTLSIAFSVFLITAACSVKTFRWFFSNRGAKFLGIISFNMYMWHQRIMVRLCRSMGYLSGNDVTAAGVKTQWLLTIEALALSLIISILTTYLFERPLKNKILKI